MGVSIKPNGKYLARVRVGGGVRKSRVFDTRREAENWIEEVKHGTDILLDMTVAKFFKYWIETLMCDIRINTRLSYESKYRTWIGPVIGHLSIRDVKPYHCIDILGRMKKKNLKTSSIDQVRIIMHEMFASALENGFVSSNPVTKSVKVSGKVEYFKDTRCLSKKEQMIFLEEAKKHKYFDVFLFILQTGLRYGELTGLQWSDISDRYMRIQRSACFLEDHKEFVVGEPKSKNGYRDIYLTDTAIDILERAPKTSIYVFPPTKRSTYNMQLKRICTLCGIEPLSIHKLRHSFATRCIESGMKPKTLQKILGHSDITITLNYYVHVMDDEVALEMSRIDTWAPDGNQTCKERVKAI